MDDLASHLGRSAELFPYGFDIPRDTLAFLRLSRADYEAASFLDARILKREARLEIAPWAQVSAAIAALALPERCDYIFHIGHVGSTLISRLLGCHGQVFALREPLVLRSFAQTACIPGAPPPPTWDAAEREHRLSGCLRLLSRRFDAGQRPVIKATSFVSEVAAELLSRRSAPKALFMYVAPESYLATIFGGANSRQEAKLLAPSRLERLHRRADRLVWELGALSEGEIVAMSWATETAALADAAQAARERVLRLDFDAFLAAPQRHLAAAFAHLGCDACAAQLADILRGPHMQRYSKAPEHAYDTALRQAVLAEARATHGREIVRGLRWLERAAAEVRAVRDALLFAAPPQASR